ncbi:MAG: hypothetical protein S4CHLAM6_00100 [Chlamydiae bacterium]|nr:hypothetical protein [Chlamydiota bacterium]
MPQLSSTDAPYDLYQLTFKNILEEITLSDKHVSASSVPYYECPGHSEFFHRYVSRERGKQKASEHVKEVFDADKNIKQAHYEIISKLDPKGKESGYFKGLNRIYRYVIMILYQHNDNSLACPLHPFHESHKP